MRNLEKLSVSPWSIQAEGDFSVKVACCYFGRGSRFCARTTIGHTGLLRLLDGLYRQAPAAFVADRRYSHPRSPNSERSTPGGAYHPAEP